MKWRALLVTFVITNVAIGAATMALAQTQTQQLVAPAKTQFSDNNGVPALVLPAGLNSRSE
jgi:hypothetical protein